MNQPSPDTPPSELPHEQDAIIRIEQVSKQFGAFTAVEPTTFSVLRGEFFALLGPSGCGKTTLLRILSGFHAPSGGKVFIDGEDMSQVPPHKRCVNMVFQSYAVFPHMSVGDNVGYGLKIRRTPKAERIERVRRALELVRLDGLEARRPSALSGGQQQRVALARALVMEPKVLLLDEPLSALDAKLREHMRGELVRLQKQVGITFIIVTHDQSEALSMADRIAVMHKGRLEQLADPTTLYESPCSRFVADFIGRINFFSASVRRGESEGGGIEIDCPALGSFRPEAGADTLRHESHITAALRPEKVEVSSAPPEDGSLMREGTIAELSYYGDYSNVVVALDGVAAPDDRITSFVPNDVRGSRVARHVGQKVFCSWFASDILLIDEPPSV